MIEHVMLLIVAALFAMVTGANDGSTMLSPGIPFVSMRTATAIVVLVTALVLTPFVSTRVATTFTRDLVSFDGASAMQLMVIAIVGAMVVVGVLALLGLPTSLGLAMVGGIVGVGLGAGLGIEWGTVVIVLTVGAIAPIVGGLIAFFLATSFRLAPLTRGLGSAIKVAHRLAFVALCIAYSFNGGQKMLAVFAVAMGAGVTNDVEPEPALLVAMGVCFAIGVALGLPAVSSKLSFGLYSVRPPQTIAAEMSASTAALASTAIGAPISMTQAITGGLIGAGIGTGSARVRWKVASSMGLAWVVTLPTTVAATALAVLAFQTWGA